MAVVPDAQVHHGRAESSRRSARRVPVSLFEVGASSAVFLRRHAGAEARETGLAHLRAERRAQLRKMMFAGNLKGRQVHRLLVSLEKGIAEGQLRALPPLLPLADRAQPLLIFPGTGPRPGAVIAGRSWQRLSLARRARAAVAAGQVVTLFRFSPTTLYHRMRFVPEGYWMQAGGLFGRSERGQPLFRYWRFAARLAAERKRIAAYRPTDTF
ncbi:hypothetical protein FGG78_34780 [Thioclava sp. BHET1]|nr:hypothetical protein FGG78_34780 [Thioclava sp. BHET1]